MALYTFPQSVPVPAWQEILSLVVSIAHVPILVPVLALHATATRIAAHPPPAPIVPTLKDVNDVPLTRKLLTQAFSNLSNRLYRSFRRQARFVVHGGTAILPHSLFSHRESQGVDFIYPSFVFEYRALDFPDAEQRLRTCIAETARKFCLGADWMDDHADVALPWAQECVMIL
jgi:hypothetical protein